MGLRVNRLRGSVDAYASELDAAGFAHRRLG
ncbi:hypothetical protein, partial [Aromatoleum evansii]